jgi:hypothetical protein
MRAARSLRTRFVTLTITMHFTSFFGGTRTILVLLDMTG